VTPVGRHRETEAGRIKGLRWFSSLIEAQRNKSEIALALDQ
jgi:hypothetical protein